MEYVIALFVSILIYLILSKETYQPRGYLRCPFCNNLDKIIEDRYTNSQWGLQCCSKCNCCLYTNLSKNPPLSVITDKRLLRFNNGDQSKFRHLTAEYECRRCNHVHTRYFNGGFPATIACPKCTDTSPI